MSENTIMILIVFSTINLIVILGMVIYFIHSKLSRSIRQSKVNHFGDSAEKRVISHLKRNFPRATLMESVYLKTATGLTELDMLLICDRGLFIIEVKSHNGRIVTEGKYWTQHWNGKVIRFHNPVYQNNVHKAALESVFRKRQSFASLPIYTVTVFTSRNVIFSKNVKDVIKLPYLDSYIKRKTPVKRMTRKMIEDVKRFISQNMETSRIKQKRHKQRIYNSNSKKHAYKFNR